MADFNVSSVQFRMARAALKLSLRDVASRVGISHTMINRIESNDARVSIDSLNKLVSFYGLEGARFGSHDSVSFYSKSEMDENIWIIGALFQLLRDNNLEPNSTALIDAAKRYQEESKRLRYRNVHG